MSWPGCQNNPIDVNFPLQKSLEIFEKKISWQNLIQQRQGDKNVPLPVPNRVKGPCNSLHSCEQKLKVYLDHNLKKHSEDFFVKMHVEKV